jgi:hypothetical protein
VDTNHLTQTIKAALATVINNQLDQIDIDKLYAEALLEALADRGLSDLASAFHSTGDQDSAYKPDCLKESAVGQETHEESDESSAQPPEIQSGFVVGSVFRRRGGRNALVKVSKVSLEGIILDRQIRRPTTCDRRNRILPEEVASFLVEYELLAGGAS